jgi:anti-anti-sigma factor
MDKFVAEESAKRPTEHTEFEEVVPVFSALVEVANYGAPVVRVFGEIDIAAVPELLETIGIACSWMDDRPRVILDLGDVAFVDVYGVRSLVEQSQAMKELGGELRLLVPTNGPVARVFALLGVNSEVSE